MFAMEREVGADLHGERDRDAPANGRDEIEVAPLDLGCRSRRDRPRRSRRSARARRRPRPGSASRSGSSHPRSTPFRRADHRDLELALARLEVSQVLVGAGVVLLHLREVREGLGEATRRRSRARGASGVSSCSICSSNSDCITIADAPASWRRLSVVDPRRQRATPTARAGSRARAPGTWSEGRRSSLFPFRLCGVRSSPPSSARPGAWRSTPGELLVQAPALVGVRLREALKLRIALRIGAGQHREPSLLQLELLQRERRRAAVELHRMLPRRRPRRGSYRQSGQKPLLTASVWCDIEVDMSMPWAMQVE